MLKTLIALFNKQYEPYLLRIGDRNIALSIWDYPPSAFAKSFIEKWSNSRGIEYDSDPVQAIKSILQCEDNCLFWKNCKELRSLANLDDDDILLEFRDRMRGFQDIHIEDEVKNYKDRIGQKVARISPIIKAIQTALDEARKQKNRGKTLYLNKALAEFTEAHETYQKELDEASLVLRAASKLKRETGLFKGLSTVLNFFRDWDIVRPYLKISSFDLSLDNPYRHMIWSPVPLFYSVQDSWEQNQDKKLCVDIIDAYCDIYKIFMEIVNNNFNEKRKGVLIESLDCAKSGHFTAASSLLYSQTEGLLFDLATEVNNHSFGSLRIQIFQNPDDLRRYIGSDGKEKDLLSIAGLLFDSQLTKFFWPGFLEYFSSDFYVNRCHLAHGEITSQLSEPDYKTIMLFTISVLYTYKEFLDEGAAPVLSECYVMQNDVKPAQHG
ncbi:hypothetical protein KQH65_12450 [archaeon]|nr:hypothetical protein [archaeon]